jgi:hypothetical protein
MQNEKRRSAARRLSDFLLRRAAQERRSFSSVASRPGDFLLPSAAQERRSFFSALTRARLTRRSVVAFTAQERCGFHV